MIKYLLVVNNYSDLILENRKYLSKQNKLKL